MTSNQERLGIVAVILMIIIVMTLSGCASPPWGGSRW